MKSPVKRRAPVHDLQMASTVIAMRLPMMMMEGLTESSSKSEATRAVSEKMAAVTEGAVAAQISVMNSAATFWFDIWSGKSPAAIAQATIDKATNAALQPGRKTLRANYKRLTGEAENGLFCQRHGRFYRLSGETVARARRGM
ncbi:hypothetical protein HB779_17785 [Phyllobacterium sp. 628]|uniref:hypothetical protein n=1 Tax=Phyllobacterium sp. 628 TaxID=2718938 RepID=UPI00166224A5|nr:hypothetical protein [Phyllobacterium sp. 628]QND53536.1 hypothetical protein HB779_17785 [Phyllobacterium sp. 628]